MAFIPDTEDQVAANVPKLKGKVSALSATPGFEPDPEEIAKAEATKEDVLSQALNRAVTRSRQAGGFPEYNLTTGQELGGVALGSVAGIPLALADIAEAAGIPTGIPNIPEVRAAREQRGAAAEGALQTALFGGSDAAARRLLKAPTSQESPETARAIEPLPFMLGQFGGLAVNPLGLFGGGARMIQRAIPPLKSSPGISRAIINALAGGAYGYGGKVAKNIEEADVEKPLPAETFTEGALTPTVAGAAAGAAIPFAAEKILAPTALKISEKISPVYTEKIQPMVKTYLTQALRPIAKLDFKWEPLLERAPQEIKNLSSIEIKDLDTLAAASKEAMQKVGQTIQRLTGSKEIQVDGKKIFDRIMEAVTTKKVTTQSPEEIQAISREYAAYKKPLSLQEAEEILEETNAGLDSFYQGTPERVRASKSDVSLKAEKALAEGLRDQINEQVDAATGKTGFGRDLKRTWGDISRFSRELRRRYLVAKRQAQFSLNQQMQGAGAAGSIVKGAAETLTGQGVMKGAATALRGIAAKEYADWQKAFNTSDALVKRAFDRIEKRPSAFDPSNFPSAPGETGKPVIPPAPTSPEIPENIPAATRALLNRPGINPAIRQQILDALRKEPPAS